MFRPMMSSFALSFIYEYYVIVFQFYVEPSNIVLKCTWGAGTAIRQVLTVLIVNDKNDKHDKT